MKKIFEQIRILDKQVNLCYRRCESNFAAFLDVAYYFLKYSTLNGVQKQYQKQNSNKIEQDTARYDNINIRDLGDSV